MRVDRGGHEAAAVGDVIAIPGGEMRVDRVNYWRESQHMKGMPGMKISDPLPKGYRRFWVDVTLRASSAPGIRYVPEAFTVSAGDIRAVPPHWAPDGLSTIVPGAQATVTLMYQVPKESGDVLLALGDSREVTIPGPNGPAHTDDGH